VCCCNRLQSWYTALMFAAKRGHVDIVRTLLEASADVNAVGKVG
jgi:ankyrin repeat protein